MAIYAAVVATGSLGWQVYRWQSDRKGRLNVSVSANYWVGIPLWGRIMGNLFGTIINTNDYPVRLDFLRLTTKRARTRWIRSRHTFRLSPEDVGLPPEVPAHDSVSFHLDEWNYFWPSHIRKRDLNHFRFEPGYVVELTVKNSLGRFSRASASILDLT